MKSKRLLIVMLVMVAVITQSAEEGITRFDQWRANIQLGDILYDPYGFGIGDDTKTGHIGIYVGSLEYGGRRWDNQVIESTLTGDGVYFIGIETWDPWHGQQEAWILRPLEVDQSRKAAAVNFVKRQIGKPYNLNFFRAPRTSVNNESWYCSELVWAAYWNEGRGVNLVTVDVPELFRLNSRVSPLDIYNSNRIEAISYYGPQYPLLPGALRVHNVSLQRNYGSIAEALIEAATGNIIFLDAGSYLERVVVETPGIKFYARPTGFKTYADIYKRNSVWDTIQQIFRIDKDTLTVKAPGASFYGIVLRGSAHGEDDGGLFVDTGANRTTARNCISFGNSVGLKIRSSSNNYFSRFVMDNNERGFGWVASFGNTLMMSSVAGSSDISVFTEDTSSCPSVVLAEQTSSGTWLSKARVFRDNLASEKAIRLYYELGPGLTEFVPHAEWALPTARRLAELTLNLDSRDGLKKVLVERRDVELAKLIVADLKRAPVEQEILSELKEIIDKLEDGVGHSIYSWLEENGLLRDGNGETEKLNERPVSYIYLNDFGGNDYIGQSDYSDGLIVWNSPRELNYIFSGRRQRGYLGNYWGGDVSYWTDRNGNGVADTVFSDDRYPLVAPVANYFPQSSNKDVENTETAVMGWDIY